MKTRNALTWLACLFVLPSLTGCGETRHEIKAPQIIEVPVPAYQPLDARLTDLIPEPPPPAVHCLLAGAPAVCVLDGLATIEEWRGALRKANADRATAAKVTKQPGEP
ncbi:hypothetical protein [Pinirhizobacter sp.]|jgi:hypothetical protein|uniref:hypothetical protein n=1 Tax=Pinirhizobacter sp. TaxID=2950432 RepID=UPI002F3F8701